MEKVESIEFGFTSVDSIGDKLIIESNVDHYGVMTNEARIYTAPFCVTVVGSFGEMDYNVTELTLEQAEELVKELTKAINFLKE